MGNVVTELVVRNAGWEGIDGLAHGITTRAALPEPGKLDLFEVIRKGRAAGAIPIAPTLGGDQTHEDRVAIITEPLQPARQGVGFRYDAELPAGEFPATDALVTTLLGILLAIQTADCLPLFYVDQAARVIGLAHCGWRGLRANLTAKVTDIMRGLGATPANLRVWLGPCICAEAYEVGPGLVGEFAAAFPGAPVSPDGTHLDLPAIARWQLVQAGVAEALIEGSGACTRTEAQRFHSYRAQGPDAGRMVSFIGWI